MKLHAIRNQSSGLSFSYLFLEQMLESQILTEAAGSRLGSLISASLAKIQNFLAPGVTGHLDALLSFIAPKGGGLKRVQELVAQSKQIEGDITQNDDWWRDIFRATGIQDPSAQHNIRTKITEQFPINPQPQPEAPQQQQAPQPQKGASRLRSLGTYLNGVSERFRQGFSEAVAVNILKGLIPEHFGYSSLKYATRNLLRRQGMLQVDPDDWLKRFMKTISNAEPKPIAEGIGDFLRGARHFLTNPQYSSDKLDQSAQNSRNQHAAKLAVQMIFDHLNREMTARLRVAGLTMKDLHDAINFWNKLNAKYQQGSRDPRLLEALKEQYQNKIKPIVVALYPEINSSSFGESREIVLQTMREDSDKNFFSYDDLSSDMWRKKIKEQQKTNKINFDLENDEEVAHREIVIDQDTWEFSSCKFKCALYSAGGDWESPVLYFRCQLVDGYAKGVSHYGDSHFIIIPNKEQGNGHLMKTKKGLSAPDQDGPDTDIKPNESQAWKFLKTKLKEMVEEEITDVRKENA